MNKLATVVLALAIISASVNAWDCQKEIKDENERRWVCNKSLCGSPKFHDGADGAKCYKCVNSRNDGGMCQQCVAKVSKRALNRCLECVHDVADQNNHKEWVCTQVCTSDKFRNNGADYELCEKCAKQNKGDGHACQRCVQKFHGQRLNNCLKCVLSAKDPINNDCNI